MDKLNSDILTTVDVTFPCELWCRLYRGNYEERIKQRTRVNFIRNNGYEAIKIRGIKFQSVEPLISAKPLLLRARVLSY